MSAQRSTPRTVPAVHLAQATGVPVTDVGTRPGDPIEEAIWDLGEMWLRAEAAAGERMRGERPDGALAPDLRRRARVLATIMRYLESAEVDWARLHAHAGVLVGGRLPSSGANYCDGWRAAAEEAKSIHDAQIAELLREIGRAL